MTDWLDNQWHRSPVWGGGSFEVTQQYGRTTLAVEPTYQGLHFHCGDDVGMNVGTPLYAARAGRVGYSGWALLALVSSQCDWYVHVDRVAPGIFVGAQVAKGQLVAYSGNKIPGGGASTGPHLHFEVQDRAAAVLAHYDANGRLVVPPGALDNPATSVDPVPVLSGTYGAATGVSREEDMLYVSPFAPKPARLRVFTPGSSYSDPTTGAQVTGALGLNYTTDYLGYLYSTSPVASPDVSAAAGAQPGPSYVWWKHVSGVWVPDAILDTSKLAGAPTPGLPTSGLASYFALAGAAPATPAPVDVAALAAAVAAKLPTYATPDQVRKAVADAFAAATVKLSLPS